ncbi:hypothetical protein GCM10009664_60780 [Kitasatospora gansuensis]
MMDFPPANEVSRDRAIEIVGSCRREALWIAESGKHLDAAELLEAASDWSSHALKNVGWYLPLVLESVALRADLGATYLASGEPSKALYEFDALRELVQLSAGHCPCGIESTTDGACPANPCRWPGG